MPSAGQDAARGAKSIFGRFVVVAVSLNLLLGLSVVAYDVAETMINTEEHLTNTTLLLGRVVRGLRKTYPKATDVELVRQAAELTQAPMAVLARDGTLGYATTPAIGPALAKVFPDGVKPGVRVRIDDELDWLSGAWSVTPLSDEHQLLVVAIRRPEEEGRALYMTVAAGVIGLAVTFSFLVILALANWMLHRPLGRLLRQLTGALQRQLAFRNNLIDASAAVGMVAANAEGTVQIYNSAAERILGHPAEAVVGQMTLDELRRCCRSGEQAVMRSERQALLRPRPGEEIWVDAGGREHLLSVSTSPFEGSAVPGSTGESGEQDLLAGPGVLVTFTDLTERRRLEADLRQSEQQLLQSAKMATLGEMATGVAHELNQPLNNIGLLASRMTMRLRRAELTAEEQDFFKEKLEKVRGQVQRAGKIIDHLRTFGHPSRKTLEGVDAVRVVRRVVELLSEQLAAHGVTVAVDLPEDLPAVHAEENQLEQVVMNLMLNARDALDELQSPPPGGKRVTVRAGQRAPAEGPTLVWLEVSDNGAGIPAELRSRVFEPFVTTKEVGKGTGLGLSISYGLVRDFGGTLEVDAESSQTRFIVTLRCAGAGPPESGAPDDATINHTNPEEG